MTPVARSIVPSLCSTIGHPKHGAKDVEVANSKFCISGDIFHTYCDLQMLLIGSQRLFIIQRFAVADREF